MNELYCPSKKRFQVEILALKKLCTTGGVALEIPILEVSQEGDEYDNTNAFDFIDDEWFDEMYSKVELILRGSWYVGDGSFEHRVASVMVAINVGHMLQNGNKRSSILVLFVLCLLNGSALLDCSKDAILDLAKNVAKAGNDKKEDSVSMVREFLKSNLKKV